MDKTNINYTRAFQIFFKRYSKEVERIQIKKCVLKI